MKKSALLLIGLGVIGSYLGRTDSQHLASSGLVPDSYNSRFILDSKKMPLPQNIADLVRVHVNKIQEFDPTARINHNNFYHGHFVLKKGHKKHYSSLNDFLADVAIYLYHTHELDHSWSEHHIPRSFVGFPDGSVNPIVIPDSLKSEFPKYFSNGTVYSSDLPKLFPGVVDDNYFLRTPDGVITPTRFEFELGSEGKLDVFIRY